MIEVELPDGTVVEFPAGTSNEAMQRALQGYAQQQPAPAQGDPASRREAGMYGLQQGLTFGFGDELNGVMNATLGYPVNMLMGNEVGTPAEMYAQGRDRSRARLDSGREQFPVTAYGSEIGGAVGTGIGLGLGAVARGAGIGTKVGTGMAVGAGEGAAYGFGSADGGVQDRLTGAGQGALLGGAVGGAAPLAVGGVSAMLRGGSDMATGLVGVGNTARAQRQVAAALPDDAGRAQIAAQLQQAADEGQGVYTLADAMGEDGRRMLSGSSRQPGPGRTMATDVLDQRQLDQVDRLSGFVNEGFPMPQFGSAPVVPGSQFANASRAQTAQGLRDRLGALRGDVASVQYGAARADAGPVDVRGALAAIDDRIGGMQGSGVSGDGIDATFQRFRSRLAAQPGPDGANRELSDFQRVLGVKQDVQDAIEVATRAGRNNEARELGRLMRELDSALETSSGPYRQANDTYRDASRTMEAVTDGGAANRPGVRADDLSQQYSSLAPAEQHAFRVGYGDRILSGMETAAPTTNQARPLMSSRQQSNISLMAENPDRLSRQIGREDQMFQTRATARGGSQTADNLADQEAVNSDRLGIVGNLMMGRFGAAAGDTARMVGNAATGRNEATRAEIVRLLLQSRPQDVAQIGQLANSQDLRRALLENMVRNSSRTGIGQATGVY